MHELATQFAKYCEEVIGDTVSPSASEYIAAREQQICAELIYVARSGA